MADWSAALPLTTPRPWSAPARGLAVGGARAARHQGARRQRPQLLGQVGDPVAHAQDRLLLALQDVDLAFHERRPAGRREERGQGLREVVRGDLAAGRLELGQALLRRGATGIVTGRLVAGLPDEQADLVQLLAQPPGLVGQLRGEAGLQVGGGLVGGHQSSGMRIQPCFMA